LGICPITARQAGHGAGKRHSCLPLFQDENAFAGRLKLSGSAQRGIFDLLGKRQM
jgi:hypothetical protein